MREAQGSTLFDDDPDEDDTGLFDDAPLKIPSVKPGPKNDNKTTFGSQLNRSSLFSDENEEGDEDEDDFLPGNANAFLHSCHYCDGSSKRDLGLDILTREKFSHSSKTDP